MSEVHQGTVIVAAVFLAMIVSYVVGWFDGKKRADDKLRAELKESEENVKALGRIIARERAKRC